MCLIRCRELLGRATDLNELVSDTRFDTIEAAAEFGMIDIAANIDKIQTADEFITIETSVEFDN